MNSNIYRVVVEAEEKGVEINVVAYTGQITLKVEVSDIQAVLREILAEVLKIVNRYRRMESGEKG